MITVSGATAQPFSGDSSPDLNVTVPPGGVVYIGIHDRSESVTVTGVSDSGGGTWTPLSGPTSHSDSTHRQWTYLRTGGSSGAITITVALSAAVNSALAAVCAVSDVGPLSLQEVGDPLEDDISFDVVSDTVTFPGPGVAFCFVSTSNNTTISGLGDNQVNETNASGRAHMISRKESSGTVGVTGTTSGPSIAAIALFVEPTGGFNPAWARGSNVVIRP